MKWWLLGIAGITFLPIFRGAGHSRHDGVTFWQLLRDSTRFVSTDPFGHLHLPYNEAVQQAQAAYRQLYEEQCA